MDEAAASRATSVYLVEKRIDMLPKALTEDICSLRGGVERMTFSVLWARHPKTAFPSDNHPPKASVPPPPCSAIHTCHARCEPPLWRRRLGRWRHKALWLLLFLLGAHDF